MFENPTPTPSEGVVIFIIKNHGLYMSQRLNTPCFQGGWQCAGGGIEPGENSLTAAIRELNEETGLNLPEWRFSYWGSDSAAESPFGSPFQLYFWAVTLTTDEVPSNTEPDKHSDWEFVPKEDVLQREVLPGIRSEIPRQRYFEQ